MVFVTVGTTEFDALVQAMDAWAADHGERVVVQIGHGTYVPRHAEHFRFAPTLIPYYNEADLVVAHGGLGTTMEVLHLGKPLVSVSNPDRYDRHQEDLLEALEAAGHLLWCRDLQRLPEAIAEARGRAFTPYTPPPCRIHEVIAAYLRVQFGAAERGG
jgi:UDP-N-acetylglucosamine transferase subunit ALG13